MAVDSDWNESARPVDGAPGGDVDWMRREERASADGGPWPRRGALPVEFGETEEGLNPKATGGAGWYDGLLPEQEGDPWASGDAASGAGLLSKGGEEDG